MSMNEAQPRLLMQITRTTTRLVQQIRKKKQHKQQKIRN